jgi:ligand-binding sensor domain-containing protein/signal transduction histidine kinase
MSGTSTARGLLLLLLAGGVPARAQPEAPGFERLHSADGLSHNSVYAIMQDRAGFLWFGTVDGLNRYDGYTFTVFRHDHADTTSLSNNLVRALYEDRAGRLWVGTEQGVDRLDGRTGRFRRYAVPAARAGPRGVLALAEDAAGVLWAAGPAGLLRYDASADRFVPAAGWPPHEGAFDLRLDPRGRLWVLGAAPDRATGHLHRLDDAGRPAERLAVGAAWGHIDRFDFDRQGRPWLNERGPGVRDGGHLRPGHPERPASAFVVEREADGTLWVGTGDGGGLCRVDGEELACGLLDPDNRTWLHNYVRSVYRDRAGALWVGTYGGVYRHDPHRKPFALLRHDPNDAGSLSANAVSAVARTRDGTLWVATFGGGLNRRDPFDTLRAGSSAGSRQAGRFHHYRHQPGDAQSLPDDVVWHLLADGRGRLWAATARGLARYDPAADAFRRYPLRVPGSAADATTTFLAEDPAGGLWVGTFEGLFHLDPTGEHTRHYPATGDHTGLGSPAVTALLVEDHRTLWVAGAQGHLSRLDVPTGRFTHYVPRDDRGAPMESETAYDLHRTADGALWLATGAGLHRFDPATGAFRHYGVREGLPGAVVYSIAEGARGALWLGTNRGLTRFDPPAGATLAGSGPAPATGAFRPYDLADGTGTMEFNRHATFRDADGTLYFGGVDGLTVFHPDAIRDNPYVPPVVFTRVETARREGIAARDPAGLDALTLTHRDDAVTFEFAALNFTDPHKNRYAYRLEGFDPGWVDAGTQRAARYTNLPPGRYTFRVRGSNNDGVWNLEGAALAVTVRPPFWQTSPFRLLVAAVALGLLYAAYRVRVRRLLEVERLRLRIASDLHDDLATDLSGIALVSDVLLRRPTLAGDDRHQLAEVRDTALGMVEGLRDIVWTINPEHDTLDAMVRRMRQVAARLLAGQPYTFEAAVPAGDRAVAMTLRRDVLLIYKEALHNAARHAGAARVAIRLEQRDGRLDLTIADDGRGFDPAAAGDGHGLRSMRARAAALGADLEVTSRPGAGTRLRLGLRVP